jgi:hypothetical protein
MSKPFAYANVFVLSYWAEENKFWQPFLAYDDEKRALDFMAIPEKRDYYGEMQVIKVPLSLHETTYLQKGSTITLIYKRKTFMGWEPFTARDNAEVAKEYIDDISNTNWFGEMHTIDIPLKVTDRNCLLK